MLAAALWLALPASAQAAKTPPCEQGFSEAAARALDLTRAQWEAACAGKPAPKASRRRVTAADGRAKARPSGPAARWRVYGVSGKEVLRYRDEAGLLVSTGVGGKPRAHAFLSGEASDPESEDALRAVLEASRDAADFRTRLQHAGFLVLPDDAGAPVPPGSRWEVLKAGRVVMRLTNAPGPLASSAGRGPASAPPASFLTASPLDPLEEDALKRLLDESRSTAEFLRRLEKSGYAVRPQR